MPVLGGGYNPYLTGRWRRPGVGGWTPDNPVQTPPPTQGPVQAPGESGDYPGGMIGERSDYELRNAAMLREMEYRQRMAELDAEARRSGASDSSAYQRQQAQLENERYLAELRYRADYGNSEAERQLARERLAQEQRQFEATQGFGREQAAQQRQMGIMGQYTSAGPLSTLAQIGQGRADLQRGVSEYEALRDRQFYDPATMKQLEANAYDQVARQTRAMQDATNSALAARGLASNPLAVMAIGSKGQFEAAGRRADMSAQLAKEQAAGTQQNYTAGAQGIAGIQSQLSQLAVRPTAEGWQSTVDQAVQAATAASPIQNAYLANRSSRSTGASGVGVGTPSWLQGGAGYGGGSWGPSTPSSGSGGGAYTPYPSGGYSQAGAGSLPMMDIYNRYRSADLGTGAPWNQAKKNPYSSAGMRL